ncbi:MAG: TerB family tellurite resistance protein [Candidatus Cyclobacteriaceae bacterium M3_2C_046]
MKTVMAENYVRDGFISLYYLMIHADGIISQKEIEMGELMRKTEMIESKDFDFHLKRYENMAQEEVLNLCIRSLKQCDYQTQIKCVAWMSHLANSDGFMDPEEWKLIYRVYHKELKLSLDDILEVQKHLPKK